MIISWIQRNIGLILWNPEFIKIFFPWCWSIPISPDFLSGNCFLLLASSSLISRFVILNSCPGHGEVVRRGHLTEVSLIHGQSCSCGLIGELWQPDFFVKNLNTESQKTIYQSELEAEAEEMQWECKKVTFTESLSCTWDYVTHYMGYLFKSP